MKKEETTTQKVDRIPLCFDDSCIMISLTSLPIIHSHDFKLEVDDLYRNYKNSLKKYFCNGDIDKKTQFEEDQEGYYQPSYYVLFSKFDLAIYSVIDAMVFGNIHFRPFDPNWPNGEDLKIHNNEYNGDEQNFRNFFHKNYLGPLPLFNKNKNVNSTVLAKQTFLQNPNTEFLPYPLVGMCQLKLSNSLTIGSGVDFYECIVKTINIIFKTSYTDKCNIIIHGSYSWNELTVSCFGRNYIDVMSFLLKIRELSIFHVKSFLKGTKYSAIIEGVIKNSLIGKYVSEENIDNAHIFANSTTTLGFHYDLYQDLANNGVSVQKISDGDEGLISALFRFSLKAGHLEDSIKLLKKAVERVLQEDKKSSSRIRIIVGKGGDLTLELLNKETNNKISTIRLIEMLQSVYRGGDEELVSNIISSQTVISINPDSICNDNTFEINTVRDGIFKYYSKEFLIDQKEIRELFKNLYHYTSKITRTRLFSSIGLYNFGISDRILFGNFIELSGFIEWLKDTLVKLPKQNIQFHAIEKIVRKCIDSFEIAWKNRFYDGWHMSDLTETNLILRGGVQQLVSVFDGSYKTIYKGICGTEKGFSKEKVMTLIDCNRNMRSTSFCLELNSIDVFYPGFFAARVTHEAAEHLKSSFIEGPNREKIPKKLEKIFSLMSSEGDNEIMRELISLSRIDHRIKGITVVPPFITSTLMSDVFADTYSFYHTFFGDAELYNFWYRNIFLSTASNWINNSKDEKTLDEFQLYKMLFRIVFALGCDKKDVIKSTWCNNKIKYGVKEQDIDIVVSIVNSIQNRSKLFNSWIKETNLYVERRFTRMFDREVSVIKNGKIVGEMVQALKQGEVYYSRQRNGKYETYRHCQQLLHSYLNHTRNLAFEDRKYTNKLQPNTILYRKKGVDDEIYYKPDIDKERDANILFDFGGGVFIHSTKYMRKYNLSKSSFIMSLWDMSMKSKINLFKD